MSSGEKQILIFAADPKDECRLRSSEEMRKIQEGLRSSPYRDSFKIDCCSATRIKDIRSEMLHYKPNIVHFCGHGQGEEGIAFEDENGKAFYVDSIALAGFFENFKDTLECVVLNACYSEVQAKEISKQIRYVIGMKGRISDTFAIRFSVAFYETLFATGSYDRAYRLARDELNMMGLPTDLLSICKPTDRMDAQIQDDYPWILNLIGNGQIIENIKQLEIMANNGHLSATLMLSMIYREGMGVQEDLSQAQKYLKNALCLPNAKPETWSRYGYKLYKPNQPSLEPAAYLTAAIACRNNIIPNRTCVGVVRIFHQFHYEKQARRYAEYGAKQLNDEKCKMLYQDILRQDYIRSQF